jgi:hypothetical protein
MRTLFLAALTTSATIFATGVTPVAASEYRYCLQGDDYAGAGDRSQLESIGIGAKCSSPTAAPTVRPPPHVRQHSPAASLHLLNAVNSH